jgi:hypothetical protein
VEETPVARIGAAKSENVGERETEYNRRRGGEAYEETAGSCRLRGRL